MVVAENLSEVLKPNSKGALAKSAHYDNTGGWDKLAFLRTLCN